MMQQDREVIVDEKVRVTIDSDVVCSRGQVSCDLAGEAVILSLATGEYYGLNPVAARIWTLLQQERRVRELRDLLLTEYPDVSADVCTEQVIVLLEELATLDLVIVRDPASRPDRA